MKAKAVVWIFVWLAVLLSGCSSTPEVKPAVKDMGEVRTGMNRSIYAVSKNGGIILYVEKGNCTGQSRVLIYRHRDGKVYPGCWVWSKDDIVAKYIDEGWGKSYVYPVEYFDKNPYYVDTERKTSDLVQKR